MKSKSESESEIQTIRDLVDRRADTQPEVVFLIGPETRCFLTFRRLQEHSRCVSIQLQQLELERGDKVAFLMDNGLFTAQLFLGAMYGGFVSVPLNVRAGVSQLSYTLDHCDAKVVFVEEKYAGLIKEVLAGVRRAVRVIPAEVDCFVAECVAPPPIAPPVPAMEDVALLMYTSGSTGQPKAAVHSHRSILAQARNSVASHQLASTDRSLLVLPLYHINAECVTLIATLLSGGSVVVPHQFVVRQFWDWMDEYRCTWSALVPTIVSQLLDWKDPRADSREAAFKRIRFLRSSSAPLSPSLHREFLDKFRLPLIQAMGSTEAGNIFSNPVPPGTNKIGSPGLPWGFEARIVNREGTELPPGEPGEVLIRGAALMQGYYKDPAETAAVLKPDGWFHTGDFAYRDKDGYFFVVGRSKELIIKGGVNIAPKQIPPRNRSLPCPLSPAQERLWFMEQLNSGVPVYNESEAVRLVGKLDVEAMELALNAIIARHEILRSTIRVIGGQAVMVVHESWPLEFKRIDLGAMSASEREAEVERLLIDEPRRPYHLETSPGIRTALVRLGPEEHVFILMMHHIICDWSSEGVLWRELSAFYRALMRGEPLNLPPLQIQHGDYAAWQKQQMAEGAFANDLAYWEENLRGSPELLELPTDRPRPSAITYRGTRKRFRIGSTLVQALRDCSRREKVSLFTLFTAALDTLLYRYTGSEDILVGLPLADRGRPELQSVIGFLLHVHALRTRLSGDMTFRELLARVQKGVLDLYSHRSPPLDQVVSRVRPERDASYSPLVQVIINWRDRDQQLSFIGMDGLEVESLLAETGTSKFDLTLILTDEGDDISLEMEYNTDIFDDARIVRMVGHYRTLLEAVADDPDRRLAELPMLTDTEHEQLLIDWNQTAVDYPKDRCVHELVEEQAEHTPEAVAAVFKSTQLTYRQLNDRANQLAHHLQKLGVGPDTLVGICVERSLEMVVGLLGILKAGGAYLPLDPGYPKERLAFMVRDSGAPVLLTDQRLRDQLEIEDPNCQVLCLDADWGTIAGSPTRNPTSGVRPDNLAYVIYTSGSTGEPKGVELMHGGLLNLIFWHRRTYQVGSADKATQLAGVGFDASVWELWPYLTAGASIHMPDEDTRLLPEKLRDWLVGHEITLSFVPTPLAEALVALPWPAKVSLRAMLTGGDRLTSRVPPSLPFPLVNHYGPTESTVVTTCAVVDIDSQDGKAPPIGKPIANTLVYLLDSQLHPVPIGLAGEVHIGGDGLARGYYNRPELTAEKFIPNPFSGKPGARLYKTGDLARYLPTGTIEFLGRNDDQVKIRAFRIELGEIESVLARHPGVRAAVVVASEDGLGEKRLTAYATIHPPKPTANELREHLKKLMPDYTVPSAVVILEQFPLTPNGKVDRTALPSPASANTLRDETGAAPVTVVENTVASIVAALLGIDRVGAEANFFDLGGHSLLATQLIARVRDKFGIDLPILKVFESPTVSGLSADIEQILLGEVEAMSEEEIQQSLDCLPEAETESVPN